MTLSQLKKTPPASAVKDVVTGVIIALVSIPISMGYAQVAGLSPVYGLYGSVFPILIFGLLSSSKRFIFGVDAAPAALVGTFLASIEVAPDSLRAHQIVPVVTLFVGFWLLTFRLLHAGKLVNYISTPVMGGFISGISATIILMQLPKLMGGSSGIGELPELVRHIIASCKSSFNPTSLLLGSTSLALLLVTKKLCPKLPTSVIVMAAGAALGMTGFAEKYNVATLADCDRGLPPWSLPHIDPDLLTDVLPVSLTIAIVIMAETLLASGNTAARYGEKVNGDREVLTYSLANIAAALTGCCPVNGSVSRSAMGEQYGGSSQIMSVTASVTMTAILLFATGFIRYLPVPVLTAIVIAALLGAVEFHLVARLFKQDRRELPVFFAAFFGVLLFGTAYGVLIGVTLSFVSMIRTIANPKRSFLGVIPGHEGFHSLERNTYARPVRGVIMYRFSSNLCFANVSLFVSEIEAAVTEDTRAVVVDSGAICSIDITSADRIAELQKSLSAKGVSLFFASHIGALNDRMRDLGLGYFVDEGHCRRTVASALSAAGFDPPYDIESPSSPAADSLTRLETEWAYGTGE